MRTILILCHAQHPLHSARGTKTTDARGNDAVVADLLLKGVTLKMARKSADVRPKVVLRSTAGTGTSYVTEKNRRNDPERLVLRKYDPRVRRHVEFTESR